MDMNCSRIRLNERRYKPPIRVSSGSNNGPIIRPCLHNLINSNNKSNRSLSPHTSLTSSANVEKTPLMIVNLKMAKEVKTLAPKKLKRDPRKLPSFCIKYQNSLNRKEALNDEKIINEFLVQGTLLNANKNNKRCDRNILITCDTETFSCEKDCDCDSDLNVFNNLNTDLLLSLDGVYEMDCFGRNCPTRTPTPVARSTTSSAPATGAALIPHGYHSILRTPSPTPKIIRIDLLTKNKKETTSKDIYFNMHRLKEKRGARFRKIV